MINEQALLEKLHNNFRTDGAALCESAYRFALEKHGDQKRASGEPYIIHPMAVAEILLDLGLDEQAVAAAFLHDVLEDTAADNAELSRMFGSGVLELVEGVTKLSQIVFTSLEEEQAENFRKIFVAMAKDIRVIIIKLADRLHNMRSLQYLSYERQQRLAKETLEIYCPLAGRLGISHIKCELDDLCLKYLHPDDYERLVNGVRFLMGERQEVLSEVVAEVKSLLAESGIDGEVFGRQKHLYSIWKKMNSQNKTLDQIYDLAAVRVVVNTLDECYDVFGKIHKKWHPMPGRIKDYISTPKKNMYQSLHTTVVTNYGQPVEIQIRTVEMHKTAEFGIAAHWKYKEHKDKDTLGERLSWIREAMEWQGGFKDSKDFLDSIKGDLYSDELLVFTPRGDVRNMPKGSTPIDFAYSIHSAVGNKCVGAKVNGKMVPLTTELVTGDRVEIITSNTSKGPSWDWLKVVKNSGTRAKIKQFFKREMKDENIRLGKSMLEQETKKRGYEFGKLLTAESFKLISARLSFSTVEEMYASVGLGAVTTNQIIYKLIDIYKKEHAQEERLNEGAKPVGKSATGSVYISGISGLLIRFAGCCNPVPGDNILGFVSRGRGVMVHRTDCPNASAFDPQRILPAKWTEAEDASFFASIKIRAVDKTGILNDIITTVSALNVGLTSVNARVDKKKQAVVDLTVRLAGKKDLESLLQKLESNPDILEVFRTTSS